MAYIGNWFWKTILENPMASVKKQKMEGEGKGEEDERPTICFVTGNANKLREVKAIFGDDFPFRMVNRKTRTQHAKHTQHTHQSHALPTTPLLPRFFRATTQRDRTRSYLTRSLARSLLCRFARSLTFVTRSLVTTTPFCSLLAHPQPPHGTQRRSTCPSSRASPRRSPPRSASSPPPMPSVPS